MVLTPRIPPELQHAVSQTREQPQIRDATEMSLSVKGEPCPHPLTRFMVRRSGVELHRCDSCSAYWAVLPTGERTADYLRRPDEPPSNPWPEEDEA